MLIRVTCIVWKFRDQHLILKKQVQKIIDISEGSLCSLLDTILMCAIWHKMYIVFGLCSQMCTAYSEYIKMPLQKKHTNL